jgi:hypothetical protein
MKKSAIVQLYFGVDCGMMKFFTYEPQSKEQLILSCIFGAQFGEKDRMQTVNRRSRRIGFNSA